MKLKKWKSLTKIVFFFLKKLDDVMLRTKDENENEIKKLWFACCPFFCFISSIFTPSHGIDIFNGFNDNVKCRLWVRDKENWSFSFHSRYFFNSLNCNDGHIQLFYFFAQPFMTFNLSRWRSFNVGQSWKGEWNVVDRWPNVKQFQRYSMTCWNRKK